jgi:DNA-binding response OmpR family regulator
MNIGLLEDNLAVGRYMTTALGLFKHTVSTHTTGASLLEVLSPTSEMQLLPYDLVIMDLNLPGGISGEDMLMMLHANAATKELPILIISGTHKSELDRVSTRFPSIPILRKPFKLQDLVQFIDQCSSML